MRHPLFSLAAVCLISTAVAQSNDVSSEEVVELSSFTVASEPTYARGQTPIMEPKSAAVPSGAAVSIHKRADAVAVQFVLSNAADKQDTRNQELYASVSAVEAALRRIPGTKTEQREVRFNGGDRKLFSLSRGTSTNSLVSLLVLADLPPDSRLTDRVKQIRDTLVATKLTGQTKYSDGAVGLYIKNPEQYRREILTKIFEDFEFLKKGFGGEFEMLPQGLDGPVRARIAAEADLELWIDYKFTFRSIRELEATKRKN